MVYPDNRQIICITVRLICADSCSATRSTVASEQRPVYQPLGFSPVTASCRRMASMISARFDPACDLYSRSISARGRRFPSLHVALRQPVPRRERAVATPNTVTGISREVNRSCSRRSRYGHRIHRWIPYSSGAGQSCRRTDNFRKEGFRFARHAAGSVPRLLHSLQRTERPDWPCPAMAGQEHLGRNLSYFGDNTS